MKVRTKGLIKITSVIGTMLFLYLIVRKGIWEQAQESVDHEEGSMCKDWTDYLLSTAQNEDYAFAFVWVDDEGTDFSWKFCDDRELLIEAFSAEKENMLQKDEDAALWYYVKLRLDEGIYGIDIYEYMEQDLSEERDECYAHTLDGGCAYYVGQGYLEKDEMEFYRLWPKKEAVIYNGYLYLLACDVVTEENREMVAERMEQFHSFFEYNTFFYRASNHFMDVEVLYWIDHEERVTELENPKCKFLEKRARDLSWEGLDPLKGYFGILKEAEYWTEISPEMPEIIVSFQLMEELEGDCYVTYLQNYGCEDKDYRMEVRTAEDGRLLQEEIVPLSIYARDMIILEKSEWKTDMVKFVDLNGDGYLDMRIIHPNYVIDYETDGYHEYYWLWNQETEKLEQMKAVSQAQLKASLEEEKDTDEQAMPYTLHVIVKEGDSLWKLAEAYYGDGRMCRKIFEDNQRIIGDDPSFILPGMELEIAPVSQAP